MFLGASVGAEELRTTYRNGSLDRSENFQNGKLQGNSKKYLPNGTLIGEWNYKNGHLEGVSHVFHENGSLKIESNFTNGSVRDTVDNIIMMEH
jgi:antitoxin component YwqK of YwqJK toxin-antitoxin module